MHRPPPLALLLLAACHEPAGERPGGDDTGATDDTGAPRVASCSAAANLELVPLDIWGRDLTGASLSLDRDPPLVADSAAGPGVLLIPLGAAPVSLQVLLRAADHEDTAFTVSWAGEGGADGFTVSEPSRSARLVTGWQTRAVGGQPCPVFTVYAGLDHLWFAPSAAAPTSNRATLLIDPEDFWVAVAEDLGEAQRRVTWSTWWWESDFEILRPEATHATMSESERWANTAMARLGALDGVERRLLINRFWDDNADYNSYLNTDTELRTCAERGDDDFEVVLQGNPTAVPVEGQWEGEAADFSFTERVAANPRYADRALESPAAQPQPFDLTLQVASWHQKAIVVDGAVGYVTGINTKGTDWDSSAHLVYEPRRMEFEADADDRAEVAEAQMLPDFGPRRDYGVRLEGPAVRDVEAPFQQRWQQAIDEGDIYAEHASRFTLDEAPAQIPASEGGVPVQVVATMPAPWDLQAIRETHAKAFSRASRYILIEDQYFRAPLMNDLIVARMLEVPDLVLIVITLDVPTYDGGAKWTYLSDATFRELFPERYGLFVMRSAALSIDEGYLWDDVYFTPQDIYTHSKLRLVDDSYLSVGSCNMNNRGYLYEGELDVSVLDETFATEARRAILAQLVGPDFEHRLTDDPAHNLEVLRDAAASNAAIAAWWEANAADLDADEARARWAGYQPSGFVYPLAIDPDYDWDVGPDLF